MKRYIFFGIIFFVFVALLAVSIGVKKPELETLNVENLTMNEEYLVLNAGETTVLLASIYPFNANNQNVLWSSSNEQVATVDNGIVTTHTAGNVRITAISEEGGFSDYCYVDVVNY